MLQGKRFESDDEIFDETEALFEGIYKCQKNVKVFVSLLKETFKE